jgi:hypothetical protein
LVYFLYQATVPFYSKITTIQNLPQIKPNDEAACQDDEN